MSFDFGIWKYLLFILFFLYCGDVFGQRKEISGFILSETTKLNGAIILNLNLNIKTKSDKRGYFSINAKKGDTLITAEFNYKTDTLIFNNQTPLIINLNVAHNVLREVVIKGSKISPLEKYNENKKEYKDIYWKGDKSKIIEIEAGTVPGIKINIDKLYSALSKQGKDARRLQKNLTQDYQNDVVDQHFSKSLVGNITGYKGEQLDDFIIKYRPSYEFVLKSSEYDIIQYIKKELAVDMSVSNKKTM